MENNIIQMPGTTSQPKAFDKLPCGEPGSVDYTVTLQDENDKILTIGTFDDYNEARAEVEECVPDMYSLGVVLPAALKKIKYMRIVENVYDEKGDVKSQKNVLEIDCLKFVKM